MLIRSFTRKQLIGAIVSFLLSLVATRLVHVQIIRGADYFKQAESNRFYQLAVPAERGLILDRYGELLAQNERQYWWIQDPTALYSVRERLNSDDALHWLATDSARVALSAVRMYPYKEVMAATVGYLAEITAEEKEHHPEWPLQTPRGKTGIELALEEHLRGVDGSITYEINALGERQRSISQHPEIAGKNVQTTLDPILSQVAWKALGDKRGGVIISDAQTGEVLSLISKPSYDPNLLAQKGETPQAERQRVLQVQQWFQDQQKPFFNRAIAGAYPPGSLFKLVTALAGLEDGVLTPATTVIDEGVLKVGEYQYGNWYFRQYGRVEGEIGLVRALARSNDIFFYKAAEWIGPSRLAEVATQFGFGSEPGLEIYPQARGIVPNPQWKEQTFGEPWYLGNTYHFGIGQGNMLVSPLQIQHFVQALANAGTQCRPTLLANQTERCHEIGAQLEQVEVVLSGMIQACSVGGTAYPFFARNEQYVREGHTTSEAIRLGVAACKTGTAEFGPADERGYRATHGWFTVIVEPQIKSNNIAADPLYQTWQTNITKRNFPERIVITVLVESDEHNLYQEGSGDAAPVAKAILDWIEQGQMSTPVKIQESAVPSE